MRKISAGLAMTLDGVVEAPSSNWLMFSDEMGEVIGAGLGASDAILLGRRTYLEFAQLWPSMAGSSPMADFMNDTPKYVLSSTLTGPLAWEKSTLLTGTLADEVAELKSQPGKNIEIPGSPRLVGSLLREGLLDELSLMVHPVMLGTGARILDEASGQFPLELVESRALGTGVLAVTYRPADVSAAEGRRTGPRTA